MRILAVSALLGPGLLALTASCAAPPPQEAAPPPAPVAAEPAPVPLVAPTPAPAVVAAQPSAPEIEFVLIPALWQRMLMQPAPAGRLLLNNFTFEPTRVQAVLAAATPCAVGDVGAVTEFVLPPNGTRVLPAPPGWDICWRRERVAGETTQPSPSGAWTAWNRAYTGPGRFLDVAVLAPSPPARVVAAVERAPAPPSDLPAAPIVPK